MKALVLPLIVASLSFPIALHAAGTDFLEGEAQEVIVKVRTSDGSVKWYRVNPDGSRKEMEMKPGDRIEFVYDEGVSPGAITVKPEQ